MAPKSRTPRRYTQCQIWRARNGFTPSAASRAVSSTRVSERIEVFAAAATEVEVVVAAAESLETGDVADTRPEPEAAKLVPPRVVDVAPELFPLASADTDSNEIRFCLATYEAGGGSVDSLAASEAAATHADGGAVVAYGNDDEADGGTGGVAETMGNGEATLLFLLGDAGAMVLLPAEGADFGGAADLVVDPDDTKRRPGPQRQP